ncbi:hypothetical protein DSO57_1006463 [Entomophthora muscae]|uniref:Uncharacterized protein n=1 Tax=Entomophthora muscae TaxID=34485 RepID=A0ACC2USK2_9FUNG|nr:hypothetical protein DSO57_1006463 [Entomophthora muscae]
MDKNQPSSPTLFHPLALAFLLSYLGAYFLLGRFNPLLGQYHMLGELFHMGVFYILISTLVTGLNPSAAIHLLGDMFSSGWVPDSALPAPLAKWDHVFDKSADSQLSEHSVYNHIIDLLPDSQPSHGPIYSCNHKKQVTLKTYLEEMTSKGFIRVSKAS